MRTLDAGRNKIPALDYEMYIDTYPYRKVGLTVLPSGTEVSTVYCGLGFDDFFETCLFFKSGYSDIVERYSTWDEAVYGHERWVELTFGTDRL